MSRRKMTKELFQEVCLELQTSHKGLNTLCKERNSSASAFYDLADSDKELSEIYTRARERQADYMADLIHEVAFDDGNDSTPFVGGNYIKRAELKVNSLKWTASKLKPKKYGDKLDVEQTIKQEQPLFGE